MGKEWYWGGRSSKRGGGGVADRNAATSSGCMSAVFQFFDFHQFQFPLHHHQHQPSFNPTSFPVEDPTSPKGVEAPRNSLKSEGSSFSSVIEEEEENLNIPMGIQIKTKITKPRASSDLSSDTSSSPGAKTPNLVARLMGLDLLPDNTSSPTFLATAPDSHSKSHSRSLRPRQPPLHSKSSRYFMDSDGGSVTRSLPDTPRISSARRSDVDHHRLSLQINKENASSVSEDLELSRLSHLRRKELRVEDENRSPGHYARQIVKQVKESVSRRAGLDNITNTHVRNRDQYRVELMKNHVKSKKAAASKMGYSKVVEEVSPGKHSTPSCSPRLRLMEYTKSNKPANSRNTTTSTTAAVSSTKDQTPDVPKPVPKPVPTLPASPVTQAVKVEAKQKAQGQKKSQQEEVSNSNQRNKKTKLGSRVVKKQQEETFVRPSSATRSNIPDTKKCKKTPLSNHLLNHLKTCPSPHPTKIPHKQPQHHHQEAEEVFEAQETKRRPQLSRSPSQKYHEQEATHALGNQDRTNGGDGGGGGAKRQAAHQNSLYHQYITRILIRTGIDSDTPVSFTRWFSPSHPLDPSIFTHLENQFSSSGSSILGPKCNRMLVFHLIDELLVQFLKPHFNMKPWANNAGSVSDYYKNNSKIVVGSQLVEALCWRIDGFPCADCQVLEDIDALIDKDLPHLSFQNDTAFEEEGEGVVCDIESDILDTLLHETALVMHRNDVVFWS